MSREHVSEHNTPHGAYSADGQNARIPSPVSHVGTEPRHLNACLGDQPASDRCNET